MSYFQNPFVEEFRGNWVLGDRAQSFTFACPSNAGRGPDMVVSWEEGPFNLSGNDADGNSRDELVIWFALKPNFDRWHSLTIDVTTEAANTASVAHHEVVSSLNANQNFSGWFTASLNPQTRQTIITSKRNNTEFRFYIANGKAEEALQFNARAGVAELPTYFDRHKIIHHFASAAERDNFPDGTNHLVPLDPNAAGGASVVDDNVIANATDAYGRSLSLTPAIVKEDWELLRGRSGLFMFSKIDVDGSNRITEIIEYHAGAKAGDLARKINYTYTGANTQPDQITEIPYTLESGDLITP